MLHGTRQQKTLQQFLFMFRLEIHIDLYKILTILTTIPKVF